MGIWQWHQLVTVTAGATVTTVVPVDQVLERLTLWANSGRRVLVNASCQLSINGQNYNPAVPVVARAAADVLYSSGGATSENNLLPYVSLGDAARSIDPFEVAVAITNNDAVDITVSLSAIGVTPGAS